MSGSQLLLLGGTPQVASDPNFEYTTLLLPGNGTNGAQNNTFLDSSTNAFSITRNGNTTQGTFSPFSQTGWGNFFDGSGDFVYPADNSAFAYGTGDFTVEAWVYPASLPGSGSNVIIDQRESTPSGGGFSLEYTSTGRLDIATSTVVLSSSSNLTTNQWQHVAMARNGSTLKLFINGAEVGSVSNSTNLTSQRVTIGAYTNRIAASSYFPGYISNVRLVKGTAVYTAAFTPSTTPLTAISGTSLLTCQSNRFIDNSTNAFAITANGDVSVQAFSPFNPTAAWSASTNGGSGYFDGSGDYLDIAHNAVLTPAGDFTIEFWAYPLTASGIREWYTKGIGIQFYSNGAAWGLALSSNNSGTYYINATFGTLIANAWQHVVVTRSGNSYVGFVNGVATSLGTTSSAPGTGTDALRIGDLSVSGGYPVFGYMSAVRYVNGTAVYGTSNFTPPTSPPTAVANTQLLTNFTNAGIYDATSKNDLETVGNAQISTTQSKFGGSSMYFDGTGDWLALPASQNFAFGTGDFTIEGWLYASALGSVNAHGVFQQGTSLFPASVSNSLALGVNPSGTLVIYAKNTNTNSTATVSTGLWVHFALVRFGTTTVLYANGTAVITVTSDSTNYTGTFFGVGSIFGTSGTNWNGYIDDLRITKGYARYTANFTAPTAAFPLL